MSWHDMKLVSGVCKQLCTQSHTFRMGLRQNSMTAYAVFTLEGAVLVIWSTDPKTECLSIILPSRRYLLL